jgi:hypothetical protein
MSARSIRLFEQDQAARGKPVRRPLSLREQARKLRERAAADLALAAELDEAADVVGEPR